MLEVLADLVRESLVDLLSETSEQGCFAIHDARQERSGAPEALGRGVSFPPTHYAFVISTKSVHFFWLRYSFYGTSDHLRDWTRITQWLEAEDLAYKEQAEAEAKAASELREARGDQSEEA